MIDVVHKIHMNQKNHLSNLFTEVTVDSINDHALYIGYSSKKVAVYADEIDELIEALRELKRLYL